GGPIGDVRDPETGLGIGTMVYGDFSIRVTEPEKLVVGLVGMGRSSNDDFLGWFKGQVLKVTRDRIAELLVKKRWPLLDVTSGAYTEEIETEVIAGLKPHVDTYGMTVVRMGNFHVSIKEEDEATLKKLSKDVAYSRLAGGFQQYAQGQAMLGAAEGMAKGGEGSGAGAGLQGMGMGMGFGMAQMFTNQQQQNQQQHQHQQQQQPAPAAAPADTRSPVQRLKELKELKDAGVVSDDEYNAKRAELMKLL
ncbi:MAG TPA: SPFH domain-containing protein, partial [Archangium sp.]